MSNFTSASLGWRLLRHSTPSDPTALTVSQAAEVAGAISAGLGLFFRAAPATMRRTSASALLPAPRTIDDLDLDNGATVATGTPFLAADRGRTIQIEGESIQNEIVSTTTVLQNYLGASGVHTATIYGDAIVVDSRLIERIIGDPWVVLPDGQRVILENRPYDRGFGLVHALDRAQIALGMPIYYSILEAGQSQSSDAQFIIKVFPMPTVATVIRFDLDVMPTSFDHTGIFQIPIDLPLSTAHVETILIPICERELLRSTLYKGIDPVIRDEIQRAALRAEAQIPLLPRHRAPRRGRIRTADGW